MQFRGADIHTVVLDEHRGRGVGAALVTAAERAAVDRGGPRCHGHLHRYLRCERGSHSASVSS
ncbi:GNAT family N-acetyltransferase [Streptomyces sp. NPDC046197]|uniref:GNAT family N-acetyltransferase n=1 Tax=Streptomyces sp. NPDC046197 TaxID=3154337 RepID=UPI0033C08E1E